WSVMASLGSAAFLIEPQDVARGVAEPGGDLGRVGADGLHDLTAVGHDKVEGCCDVLDHDVDQHARLGRRAADDPGAAHLPHPIVERQAALAALADVPPRDGLIERGGTTHVDRGDFDVAHLAVCECGRHEVSLPTAETLPKLFHHRTQ